MSAISDLWFWLYISSTNIDVIITDSIDYLNADYSAQYALDVSTANVIVLTDNVYSTTTLVEEITTCVEGIETCIDEIVISLEKT